MKVCMAVAQMRGRVLFRPAVGLMQDTCQHNGRLLTS